MRPRLRASGTHPREGDAAFSLVGEESVFKGSGESKRLALWRVLRLRAPQARKNKFAMCRKRNETQRSLKKMKVRRSHDNDSVFAKSPCRAIKKHRPTAVQLSRCSSSPHPANISIKNIIPRPSIVTGGLLLMLIVQWTNTYAFYRIYNQTVYPEFACPRNISRCSSFLFKPVARFYETPLEIPVCTYCLS